jgi:hypothetical protein
VGEPKNARNGRKDEGGRGREGKEEERREAVGKSPSPVHDIRHLRKNTKPPPQKPTSKRTSIEAKDSRANQPKSRRPILATSRKLIIKSGRIGGWNGQIEWCAREMVMVVVTVVVVVVERMVLGP